MRSIKPAQLALSLILLGIGCTQQTEEFQRDTEVDVTAERVNWNLQQLSNDWESDTSEFQLSNLTLTEDRFTECLTPAEDIVFNGRVLHPANEEECSNFLITEWDSDRFLAILQPEDGGGVGFKTVCETSSNQIICYSVANDAPPEAFVEPELFYAGNNNADPVYSIEKIEYRVR